MQGRTHILSTVLIFACISTAHATTGKWVTIHQDDVGIAYIDDNNVMINLTYQHLRFFSYKYVYLNGLANLKILPKGYVQGIHAINSMINQKIINTKKTK